MAAIASPRLEEPRRGGEPGELPFAALRELWLRAHALVLEDLPGPTGSAAAAPLHALLGELERHLDAIQACLGDDAPLAQLCFVGALELATARRALRASSTPDELVAVLDSTRRRVCRVARAVLENARLLGFIVPVPLSPADDLDEALALRRLYARFRRAIRAPADESSEAVFVAARYAASALAHLVTAPAYQAARISDRAIIRRLHERVVTWARGARVGREGLHLLQDVQACAGLLRGINRREVLRAHDAELVATLAPGPVGDGAGWWSALARLEGLDDELDLLCESLGPGAHAELTRPIVAVLERLRAGGCLAASRAAAPDASVDELGSWD